MPTTLNRLKENDLNPIKKPIFIAEQHKKLPFCPLITKRITYLEFFSREEAETPKFWHKSLAAPSSVKNEKRPQLDLV